MRLSSRQKRGVCLFLLASGFWLLATALPAQGPATTTVKDTVYKSDGSLASGSVVISWPPFSTSDGKPVFGGTKTLPLSDGGLAVALTPNVGATPSGTSYKIRYYEAGGRYVEESWVVPASSPLSSPGAPTVTQVGTTGTTTYYYWISARNAAGETLLGTPQETTTSNATLSGTDYNQITWSAVSGATSYRVWRTTTATAPTGSGNYLVGTTAATTMDDQSNSLQAATVPALNDTDPRALADVRVTAAPSSSVVLAASQVSGNAIVSNPSNTQTITAPPKAGVIPLQIKGDPQAAANVFEIYNSQNPPQLQSYFNPSGAFLTLQAPTFSAMTPGSVLFAGSGGLLSQDNNNLFWDNTTKGFRVGPRSGFASLGQSFLNNSVSSFSRLNPAASGSALGGIAQDNNAANAVTGLWGVADSSHASGNRFGAAGLQGYGYHSGTGTISSLHGAFVYAENLAGSGGNASSVAGLSTQSWHSGAATTTDLSGVWVQSNGHSGGTVTNNYGIKIEDQTAGTNNWALKTGAGQVQFGDDLLASTINNVRYANEFSGADGGQKIAAAISDLPASGGVVDARGLEGAQTSATQLTVSQSNVVLLLSPSSTWTVSGNPAINITGSGVWIYLNGATIQQANSNNGRVIAFSSVTEGGILGPGVVDGNRANNASGTWGIRTDNSTRLLFQGFRVKSNKQSGIRLTATDYSRIESVVSEDNVSGNNTAYGMALYGSRYNTIVGNVVTGNDAFGLAVVQLDEPPNTAAVGNVFSSNSVQGNTLGGILVDNNAPQTAVIGNTILGNGNGDTTNAAGINVASGTSHTTVTGNLIAQNNGYGVRSAGNQTTVSGNTIIASNLHGVFFSDALDGVISANLIEDNSSTTAYSGVRMQSAHRVAVTGNMIGDRRGTPLQQYGISEDSNSSNNSYLGNNLFGNAAGDASLAGSTALSFGNKAAGDAILRSNTDFLPESAGQDLGSATLRWDLLGQTGDFSRRIVSALNSVSFSATPTFDASLGNSLRMTLTGNVTSSTISNPQSGEFIALLLCQDGTGNRTMTWPTNLKLAGGAFTLTTTANKCDSITAVYDGTNWYETARAANL